MGKYTVRKGKKNYTGTNGNDTFTTATGAKKPGSFSINAKGGNDKIYIGAGSGDINVGTGSDYVQVTGGSVSRIRLSQGKNVIKVTGGTVSRIVGDGHSRKTSDIITVNMKDWHKKLTVNTSSGADTVTVNGIHSDSLHKVSRAQIETASGDDTIIINKGGFNHIKSGDGKDKITINGGSNYVQAGNKKDTIIVNSKYGNYIDGGNGKDIITLGKNARRCVVAGGYDTINVKSTASGKVGNFIKGGSTNTINLHYNAGMTLVIDSRVSATEYRDTLFFHASGNDSAVFDYYKKNDVMVFDDRIHIIGFKKLREFNFVVEAGTYKFTPQRVIDAMTDNIFDKSFDINKLLSPYDSIKNYVNDAPSTAVMSTKSATAMGYKGY